MTGTALQISTPGEREVMMTREFDAPPRLVFEALTKPELLKRWYGPEGWSLEVCEIDLKVGGKWRFVSSLPGGKKIGQYGVYQEIVPGERMVNTEAWEDWDAGETLVTTVLAEENGRTRYTSTILFPSEEVRDTVFRSGLEKSAAPIYDRLAQLVRVMAGENKL
jgi:uncharacterized protein YndB with AHSA1/START domain